MHQFPFFVIKYITETPVTCFYILEPSRTLSLRCSWYMAGRIWLGGDIPEVDGLAEARRDSCQADPSSPPGTLSTNSISSLPDTQLPMLMPDSNLEDCVLPQNCLLQLFKRR